MPNVLGFKSLEMFAYILDIQLLLLYIIRKKETNQCLTRLALYLEGVRRKTQRVYCSGKK